jgi:hypothetical protein
MRNERMARALRLVILALSVASLAAPVASAGDRPFQGHASGAIVALPDPSADAPGVIQYTGQATHLGRFTRTEYFFLDETGRVFGWMVYTAADGDQLRLDFDGRFVSPTTAVGTYEFAGGTGRFRDASGTADFEAVLGDQGHVEVVFDGSIRY